MNEQLYQLWCREYVYDRHKLGTYPGRPSPYRVDVYKMGPAIAIGQATEDVAHLRNTDVFVGPRPFFCDYWFQPV